MGNFIKPLARVSAPRNQIDSDPMFIVMYLYAVA